MNLLRHLVPRIKRQERKIVMPEGQDSRVLEAAVRLKRDNLCHPIVLGTPDELAKAEKQANVSLESLGIETLDYTNAEIGDLLADGLVERRRDKGLTKDEAIRIVHGSRLYFGGLMLNAGVADGMVAGSSSATPDVLRAAFHCVGTAKGIRLGSSCFVMDLERPTESGEDVLLFADCGVIPNPDADQLVDICLATARTFQALLDHRPNLALLSFSTKGSSNHPMVMKMRQAAELTRKLFAETKVNATVDGEIQADAALVPIVAGRKCPESPIQGNANVMIFPDLQSGNISYKLVQRLANAKAYGPILQGLGKPINDLSRGCSTDDIVGVTMITICQITDETELTAGTIS